MNMSHTYFKMGYFQTMLLACTQPEPNTSDLWRFNSKPHATAISEIWACYPNLCSSLGRLLCFSVSSPFLLPAAFFKNKTGAVSVLVKFNLQLKTEMRKKPVIVPLQRFRNSSLSISWVWHWWRVMLLNRKHNLLCSYSIWHTWNCSIIQFGEMMNKIFWLDLLLPQDEVWLSL